MDSQRDAQTESLQRLYFYVNQIYLCINFKKKHQKKPLKRMKIETRMKKKTEMNQTYQHSSVHDNTRAGEKPFLSIQPTLKTDNEI